MTAHSIFYDSTIASSVLQPGGSDLIVGLSNDQTLACRTGGISLISRVHACQDHRLYAASSGGRR